MGTLVTPARTFTPSERDWLDVRSCLQKHRYNLAVLAAGDYPGQHVAHTPLLATRAWLPPKPVPIQEIGLELDSSAERPVPDRLIAATASVLPTRPDGQRYASYSDAVRELSPPSAFENKLTYRLSAADLTQPAPQLAFCLGRYFDGIDTGEAAAHEYTAYRLGVGEPGIRAAIGKPCDPRRRPMNLAISTLTLRVSRAGQQASFVLHWRDPAKVGHAGGLYQVIPVGVFQPSGDASWNIRNDFSLWRCILREFAEELGGHSEDYGSERAPIDYDAWPLARQMTEALGSGMIRAWCLGMGTDPLTYATDLLTVLVFDADLADQLYGAPPASNSEGRVLAAQLFTQPVVHEFVTREPMQAAGAALLALAWQHRAALLA
jgi:hypothetical protein